MPQMHNPDPDIYLPNNGRAGCGARPVDVDHLYRDPDVPLPVRLIATRLSPSHNPRDTHWRIAWSVGTNPVGIPVERQIHLMPTFAPGPYGSNHLTNWGALTKITERYTKAVTLTTLSLAERRRLEAIAGATPVRKPDGAWNSQDWLVTVIETSVQQGLVTRQDFRAAIDEISGI
ncbi:hypothetical protein DXG01_004662 [Tephrocybe rancida]|nr:hypothetical protein DXG01_004662 [Tephrocybe rancida]